MKKKEEFFAKLNDRAKNRPGRKNGLVAVTAHKELILEALEKAYSLKDIYFVLQETGEMPITYPAFTRLVRTYLLKTPKTRTRPKSQPEGVNIESGNLEDSSPQTDSKRPSYVYDPDRNKEKVSKQLGIKSKK